VADMSGRLADVVIPVYADVEVTRACIESVLWMSGEAVRRVIVVNDCAPDPAMAVMLEGLAQAHPAMVLLTNEQNLGFVGSANRGLAARHGDAVLLNSDTLVTPGWLEELLAVAYDEDRVACVSPLSNNATIYSVPTFGQGTTADRVPLGQVGRDSNRVPP